VDLVASQLVGARLHEKARHVLPDGGPAAEDLDRDIGFLGSRSILLHFDQRAGLVEALVAPKEVKQVINSALVALFLRHGSCHVDHTLHKSIEYLVLASLEKQRLQEVGNFREKLKLLFLSFG